MSGIEYASLSAVFTPSQCSEERNKVSTQAFFGLPNLFFPVQTLPAARSVEGPMVRELQLLAISLVFVFLGAIVFGLIH